MICSSRSPIRLDPVDDAGVATTVRVLKGAELLCSTKTGTVTAKFQARRRSGSNGSRLGAPSDTAAFVSALRPVDDLTDDVLRALTPTDGAARGLCSLVRRSSSGWRIVGVEFDDRGSSRRGTGRVRASVGL